jgi:diacylglycerol kinase family enzyme
VVAAAAAEAGVPYACIPSGTRNHFALDLGVDRGDVVGALDAFVDGGERHVDLAEVNGRVFVNNVSLGVYGAAVQSAGYRDAKLRTLLEKVPEVTGPSGKAPALRWVGSQGTSHEGGLAVLISNNPYRLGRMIAAGTRPRMDTGRLGVAVIGPKPGRGRRPMRARNERSVEVHADGPVPAGVDGESAVLESPVRFQTRPRALRVRIARVHPGQSPSADLPLHAHAVLAALLRMAFDRQDRPSDGGGGPGGRSPSG